jgi:hypothetical protein
MGEKTVLFAKFVLLLLLTSAAPMQCGVRVQFNTNTAFLVALFHGSIVSRE